MHKHYCYTCKDDWYHEDRECAVLSAGLPADCPECEGSPMYTGSKLDMMADDECGDYVEGWAA